MFLALAFISLLYFVMGVIGTVSTDRTCRQLGYANGYMAPDFNRYCLGEQRSVPPPPRKTPLHEAQGRR